MAYVLFDGCLISGGAVALAFTNGSAAVFVWFDGFATWSLDPSQILIDDPRD